MDSARHGMGPHGWVGLLGVLLATILSVAPAFELACDDDAAESHEYHHAHASPVVLVGRLIPPPVSAQSVTPVGRRPDATSAVTEAVFVPPRA